MPKTTLKNKKVRIKKMKDYSDDPFFKKKAEDAIKFLKKHPLPKSFKK